MKKEYFVSIFIMLTLIMKGQTRITMLKDGGVYSVPCKVNGLPLKFIFDTGASDVSISLTEASFMLKNGYLNKEDIGENVYYSIANWDVVKGTKLNIKEIEFAGLKLNNVEASIVHETSSPLLLGQSVISRLGVIQLNGDELTILTEEKNDFNYSNNIINNGYNSFKSSLIVNPYERSFMGNQLVYTSSPITNKPSMGENEKQIGMAENNIVTILEKYNEKFYKVKSGNQVGYIWSGWFKN